MKVLTLLLAWWPRTTSNKVRLLYLCFPTVELLVLLLQCSVGVAADLLCGLYTCRRAVSKPTPAFFFLSNVPSSCHPHEQEQPEPTIQLVIFVLPPKHLQSWMGLGSMSWWALSAIWVATQLAGTTWHTFASMAGECSSFLCQRRECRNSTGKLEMGSLGQWAGRL